MPLSVALCCCSVSEAAAVAAGAAGAPRGAEGGGDDERQQELHIRWLVVFTEGEAIQLTYSTAVQVTGVSEILQYP